MGVEWETKVAYRDTLHGGPKMPPEKETEATFNPLIYLLREIVLGKLAYATTYKGKNYTVNSPDLPDALMPWACRIVRNEIQNLIRKD
jgi:hypothetical protein